MAGALIDLSDAGTEHPWDKLAEGNNNIWHAVLNHKTDTFAQFWAQRTVDGFNVAHTGGAAPPNQNTVDESFRDPTSNVPVSRPTYSSAAAAAAG